MSEPATINPRIVESLYSEALVLSDEVRDAFALSGRIDTVQDDEDLIRVAMSCEGLRATTRMMHGIAWLLNHRAYFMGELSEFQLKRHGKLSASLRGSDPENMALLDPGTRELVEMTDRFYARLLRLDRSWRLPDRQRPSAIAALRDRLARDMDVRGRHGSRDNRT